MNKSPTNTGRKGEHLHDSMAKTYFGNPQNMANFLEQCLPAHMVEALDLESLESSAETFVDDAFKQYIADLVFTCKTRDGRHGSVYILFEHKSQPEPVCALQILKYMVGIWIRFFEKWIIWENKMSSLCYSGCILPWETEMERETDAGSVWG